MTENNEYTQMPWEMDEYKPKPQQTETPEQKAEHCAETVSTIKSATKSKLLLAAAILGVIKIAVSAISGTVDVFGILTVISFFMIYCGAANEEIFNTKGLGLLAGVQKAKWILIWVAIGICAVCTALLIAASSVIIGQLTGMFDFEALYNEIINMYSAPEFEELFGSISTLITFDTFIGIISVAVLVLLIIVTIVLLILNLTFYRQVKNFTSSVNKLAKTGEGEIKSTNAVRAWLMVFGIFTALSFVSSFGSVLSSAALGGIAEIYSFGIDGIQTTSTTILNSVLSLISVGASAAEYIVLSQLINKYFVNK